MKNNEKRSLIEKGMESFLDQEGAAQVYNSANIDLYKSCLLNDEKAIIEAKDRMKESNDIIKSTETEIENIVKRL